MKYKLTEQDYRHINELVDQMPDVKHYLEKLDDEMTSVYVKILEIYVTRKFKEYIEVHTILDAVKKRTRK